MMATACLALALVGVSAARAETPTNNPATTATMSVRRLFILARLQEGRRSPATQPERPTVERAQPLGQREFARRNGATDQIVTICAAGLLRRWVAPAPRRRTAGT